MLCVQVCGRIWGCDKVHQPFLTSVKQQVECAGQLVSCMYWFLFPGPYQSSLKSQKPQTTRTKMCLGFLYFWMCSEQATPCPMASCKPWSIWEATFLTRYELEAAQGSSGPWTDLLQGTRLCFQLLWRTFLPPKALNRQKGVGLSRQPAGKYQCWVPLGMPLALYCIFVPSLTETLCSRVSWCRQSGCLCLGRCHVSAP